MPPGLGVYATPFFEWDYVDGVEIETHAGFGVVHMSRSGDSAGIYQGFDTLEEAELAARRIARERNAVLV